MFKQAPVKTSANRCLNDLLHINSAALTTPAAIAFGDAFFLKISSPYFLPLRIPSQTAGSGTIGGAFSTTYTAKFFKLLTSSNSSEVKSDIPNTP